MGDVHSRKLSKSRVKQEIVKHFVVITIALKVSNVKRPEDIGYGGK
jgi:hypothetical protein